MDARVQCQKTDMLKIIKIILNNDKKLVPCL